MVWLGRIALSAAASGVAGSVVGGVEALYALQSGLPVEYQAIGYAVFAYGAFGAALGVLVGIGLAPFAALDGPRRWMLSFVAAEWLMGAWVAGVLLDRDGNLGPLGLDSTRAVALAGLFVVATVTLWIGTNLVTKTPLRGLTTAQGTLGLWASGALLSFVFSAMPAPGGVHAGPEGRPTPTVDAAHPHVFLIVIDSLRADAIGDGTPALRQIEAAGIRFDEVVAASSSCGAANASLLTARTVSGHGCLAPTDVLDAELRTVAERFWDAGYTTVGFPNSAEISAVRGFGQGFESYAWNVALPLFAKESTSRLVLHQALRRRMVPLETANAADYFVPARFQLEAGLRALMDAPGPAFVYVHLREPAGPWFSPKPPMDPEHQPALGPADVAEVRARYSAAVAEVDGAIASFLQEVQVGGRYDDMVLAVVGDHGMELTEHGGVWPGATLYDEVIRVPWFLKLPRGERAGTRVRWQVRGIDVGPTLAAAAGLDLDPSWEGEPVIDDQFDAALDLTTTPPDGGSGPPPTWGTHPSSREALLETARDGYHLQGLRAGGRKVIEAMRVPRGNPRNQPPVQFYGLGGDPVEAVDLDGRGLSEEAAMQAALQRLRHETRGAPSADAGMDPAERARQCALGYLSGPACDGTTASP